MTTLILFKRKKSISILSGIKFSEKTLHIANEVKYQTQIWNQHLRCIMEKVNKLLMIRRRFMGKTWGLRPAVMKYIYTMIIKPMKCYGAMVWWIKTRSRGPKQFWFKIQSLAGLWITEAMTTTSTAAMKIILEEIIPIDLIIMAEVRKVVYRV